MEVGEVENYSLSGKLWQRQALEMPGFFGETETGQSAHSAKCPISPQNSSPGRNPRMTGRLL